MEGAAEASCSGFMGGFCVIVSAAEWSAAVLTIVVSPCRVPSLGIICSMGIAKVSAFAQKQFRARHHRLDMMGLREYRQI